MNGAIHADYSYNKIVTKSTVEKICKNRLI